jgi:hypothetical protein
MHSGARRGQGTDSVVKELENVKGRVRGQRDIPKRQHENGSVAVLHGVTRR